MIRFRCENCQQKYRASDKRAGSYVRCHRCGSFTQVPEAGGEGAMAVANPMHDEEAMEAEAPSPRQRVGPAGSGAAINTWGEGAVLLFGRGVLGLTFAIQGCQKLLLQGIPDWLAEFGEVQPWWLPDVVGYPFAVALPFAALALGVLLMLGLFTGRAAVATAVLLVIFILGGTGLWLDGGMFHPNVAMLALALMISILGPGEWSLDDRRTT